MKTPEPPVETTSFAEFQAQVLSPETIEEADAEYAAAQTAGTESMSNSTDATVASSPINPVDALRSLAVDEAHARRAVTRAVQATKRYVESLALSSFLGLDPGSMEGHAIVSHGRYNYAGHPGLGTYHILPVMDGGDITACGRPTNKHVFVSTKDRTLCGRCRKQETT